VIKSRWRPAIRIHDWSRVDPDLFHDFHQTWAIGIRNALNGGLLPAGYSALVEQHAAGLVPGVLAVQRRTPREGAGEPTGAAVLATPPQTRHTFRREARTLAARGNRVAIRHRLGDVVCVIEIVSPGNKASRAALRAFVAKSVEFLDRGVNLLVVDLFPPTARDPQGLHKSISDEFGDNEFELQPDKPLTIAAYVAEDPLVGSPITAHVTPVAVRDALPDMPAYLDRRHYVLVPLEATYQAAWASCPSDMRDLVESGRLPGEDE
jgi:hypothetical protein